MKIVHTKGQSYTTFEDGRIARGLRPRDHARTAAGETGADEVPPRELCNFLATDPDLVIRQTISALDKVIRKPRGQNLRNFNVEAYVDRTLLSLELWKRVEVALRPLAEGTEEDEKAFVGLKDRWLSKVHPYAEVPFNPSRPRADKNADLIQKFGDKTLTRDDFRGRWHRALWKTSSTGTPDYAATAAAIWSHLFDRELKISGACRTSSDDAAGLVQARGRSIASSVNDPRPVDGCDGTEADLAYSADIYFEEDVAATIFAAVTDSVGRNVPFGRSDFGRILYDHFGPVLRRTAEGSDQRKALWTLHNAVRRFYQTLGKSERFARAIREADTKRLGDLLPANCAKLLEVLGAKDRNADVSALIRLGKLIAHASDLPTDTPDVQAAFSDRLAYLSTSDGQSEIKRNEAFTRVWRTAVALSLRTVQVLAPIDPNKPREYNFNQDPAGNEYARAAVDEYEAAGHRGRLDLLFGNKVIQADDPAARRDTLLVQTGDRRRDSEANREILWGLLRIAGEIRNRTNHFNTKGRLLAVLEGGPVSELQDPKQGVHNRKPHEVHAGALRQFRRLLDFDIALRRRVVLDDLTRLAVQDYVAADKIDELFGQFAQTPASVELGTPKFISVLRRASNLCRADDVGPPAWLKPFGALDLAGLSKVTEGANHFRIGVLRQLYASGFPAWLASVSSDGETVRIAVQEVVAFKKQRIQAYHAADSTHPRAYAIAENVAERRGLDDAESLGDLLRRLQAEAMTDDAVRRPYRVSPDRQREQASAVEEFRLEAFARLFALYLETAGLSWLWGVSAPLPADERDNPARLDEFPVPAWPDPIKLWHSQVYAWLYLVPVDDVALLRHQFRRTAALEGESGAGSRQTLHELDRLMGLYLAVNAAGFSGREHVQGLDVGKLFYEKPEQFETVYSEANETHHVSLPGTRRGLRQILRMDHHLALKGIFEKHQVTSAEVEAFADLKAEKVQLLLETKNRLAAEIIDLSRQKAPDRAALESACDLYRETVTRLALYSARIAGARLAEHARLHQLMMRILGRLVDFSLMWERDRQYVFIGMLYRTLGSGGFVLQTDADGMVGLRLPEPMRQALADAFTARTHKGGSAARRGALKDAHVGEGFLPLWDARNGYVLEGDGPELQILDPAQRDLFIRYFGTSNAESAKDIEARRRRLADGHIDPARRKGAPGFRDGKRRIRNDFAHFNMISGGRRPNLTYLTNAIRSLMSHDRKMKNAVSKAVSDLVRDEGLVITWELSDDRLKCPTVTPALETHLTMVRPKDGFDPRFCLPQASVRFTSMVKALFDFDAGGYRAVVHRDGKWKNRGELRYPEPFREAVARDGIVVPTEILAQTYPILPRDRPSD